MKIKEIRRSATVAWSPSPQAPSLIACGTAAGAIDSSFSVTGTIDIFDINLGTNDLEVASKGSVEADERFHRLAWGNFTAGDAYPYGLLAGGMVDGSVQVWSPYHIVNNQPTDLASIKRHDGPVRGLDWNKFKPNLLASGAEDGEVYVWDFSNPSAPSVYTPGPKNPQSVGAITCVAWNNKVDYVLCSASAQGAAVVWDLKAKRSVTAFGDPTKRMQPSHISWSPEETMKLVVCSESDLYPVMQMWDLRNTRSPVLEMSGHQQGILSCAWCPNDETLLMSSGKDNSTMCWNTQTGQWLGEVTRGDNDIFDVQWAPKIPAVFSTASFDGKVSIHAMHAHSAPPAASNTGGFDQMGRPAAPAAVPPPPKWLKRPCGAVFGFGGRLVSFNNPAPNPQGPTGRAVQVSTIAEDQTLYDRFTALQQALQQGGDLPTFCSSRSQAAASPEEAEAWGFMKVLLAQEGRVELLKYLQFDKGALPIAPQAAAIQEAPPPAVEESPAPELVLPPPPLPAVEVPPPANENDPWANSAPSPFDSVGADNSFGEAGLDFASMIDSGAQQAPAVQVNEIISSLSSQLADAGIVAEQPAALPKKTLSVSPIAGIPPEEVHVMRALIAGDMEAAVDASFAMGNLADALLLASLAGPGSELEKKTIQRYLDSQMDRSFMRVAMAVVDKDLSSLVRGVTADNWKEVLALLCTYASSEEFTELCNELAKGVEALGMTGPAVLCYMSAGNVAKVVAAWASNSTSLDDKAALQSFVERTVVFLQLAQSQEGSKTPATAQPFFCRYAENLAAQGHLGAAMAYLGAEDGGTVAELRYRIYEAMPEAEKAQHQPPAFPFENKDLDLMIQQTAQAQAMKLQEEQRILQEQQQAHQMAAYEAQQRLQQEQQQQMQQLQQQQQQQAQSSNQGYTAQPAANGMQYPGQQQQPQWGQPQQQPEQQPQQPQWGQQEQQQAAWGAQNAAPAPAANQWGQPQQPQQGFGAPQAPVSQPQAPQQPAWGAPAAPQQPAANQGFTQPPVYNAPTPVLPPNGLPPNGGYNPAAAMPQNSGLVPAAPAPAPAPAHQAPAAPAQDPALMAQGEAVKQGLSGILGRCQAHSNGNPGEARKIADTQKKINVLFDALSQGRVSASVVAKLHECAGAANQGDFQRALGVYTALTREHFQEISAWGPALSRLLNMGKNIR